MPRPGTAPDATPDAADRMDRMYRWTRHVYDFTRRPYLVGRDRLLHQLADDLAHRSETSPVPRVLEVGCGTARNLRRLADGAPPCELYGIDASSNMLATARRTLRRRGRGPITLAQGLAEELDPAATLGVSGRFDAVFFSYVLSMIPTWRPALDRALQCVCPGGTLYVVDFWDQRDWPVWFRRPLQGWLSLFGVHPRPALLDEFQALDARGIASLSLEPVAGRYAYLARLEIGSKA